MSTSTPSQKPWFLPVATFRSWSEALRKRTPMTKSAWALALATAGTFAGWSAPPHLARLGAAESTQAQQSQAALRALLTQADVEGRRAAVLEIGAHSPLPAKAAELLIQPLHDTDVEVRALAAMTLLQNDCHVDAALLVLSDLLESDEAEERCLAAFLLGHSPVQQDLVESRLVSHLADTSPLVQLHVAEAMLRLRTGNDMAVKVLSDSLLAEEPSTRAFAVHALGCDTHTPSATVAYRVATRLADTDLDVAAGSALTLLVWTQGVSHPAEGASVNNERIEHIGRLLASETRGTRHAAAVRLLEGASEAALMRDLCRSHLRDEDPLVRACAALALGSSTADSVAVETILSGLMESRSSSENIIGLGTLGRMSRASAPLLEAARQHLESDHASTRTLASSVLLKFAPRDPEALNCLAAGVADGTPEGRSLAARSCQLVDWRQTAVLHDALKLAGRDLHLRTRLSAIEILASRGTAGEIQRVGHTK
jgi:hypothetical protein